jgi:hypothetical protein
MFFAISAPTFREAETLLPSSCFLRPCCRVQELALKLTDALLGHVWEEEGMCEKGEVHADTQSHADGERVLARLL